MDKKYTSLEHSIRNIMTESISPIGSDEFKGTPKAFLKPAPRIAPKKGDTHPDGTAVLAQRGAAKIGQSKSDGTMSEEEVIDNVELEEDWKKTAKQAATDVADFGAMAPYAWVGGQKARSYMTGLKDTATMGMADTARAGVDYLAKNAAYQFGLGKGTTWETETKQQEEKKKKAQEAEPGAYKAGEITGVVGPVATGVGGAVTALKMAKPLAKGVISVAKNPGQLKKLSTYVGAAKDAAKGTLGLLKPQNPVTAAKDIGQMSVGAAGGVHGYYAATDKDYRDYLKDKMSKPGGTGEFVKDIGKTAANIVAPGSVEAAQGKDVGRNLTRAAAGVVSNAWLPTFAYDWGSQYFGGQGITGEKGIAADLYDKATKKKKVNENRKETIKKVLKEQKEKLNEGNPFKAIEAAKAGVEAAKAEKAAKAAAEAARAKAAAEAAAKAKAAGTNIVRPEFPSAGAAKPQKAPPAPKPEKPYVDKPANIPPGVTPLPVKTPPPYKPSTDPFVPLPPANVPSKVPQRPFPDTVPEPANPQKPAAPVKAPAPKLPAPGEGRPAPTINPYVNPAEVKPVPAAEPDKAPAPAPLKAPNSLPNPAADPLYKPNSQPLANPVPAAEPLPAQRRRPDDDAVVVPKPETAKDKGKKDEGKGKDKKKAEEKPPKRRIIPLGIKIPGVRADVLSGLKGFVPAQQYVHFEPQGFMDSYDPDIARKTIENVARPGGKPRIGKQGEIRAKILDENNKRAAVIKKTVKDSTIIRNPKLNHPELDEN